jgi:hypothetical protein
MANINLLDNRRKVILKRQARVAKINLAGMVGMAVAFGLVGITFAIYNWHNQRYNTLKTQVLQQKALYNSKKDILTEIAKVSTTLDELKPILDRKDRLVDKVEVYKDLYLQGVFIRQVDFGGSTENQMGISGYILGLAGYTKLYNYLDSLGRQSRLNTVILENLSASDTGSYNFTYTFELGNSGVAAISKKDTNE